MTSRFRDALLGATLAVAAFMGGPALAQTTVADVAGDWRGTLNAGAVQLRLALHLGAQSTFDSPDQGAMGLPVEMSVAEGKVTVVLRGAGQFVGALSADGSALEGVLQQGGAQLRFERGSFSASNRPQTPQPPFPYKVEEVTYDNPADPGVRLAGTLTSPQGAGPFPAVLLITGSGAQDRDETLFEHKPFAVLADALTRRGIAVLRVDDRGTGGSGPARPTDMTETYAGDSRASVAWLKGRKDIDPARIGLLGHSEGGVIAPMVASQDPSIAFVVLWAGPGVDGREVIVDQVRALNSAAGATAAQAEASGALQRQLLDALMASSDLAAARSAMNAVMTREGRPPVAEASLAQMNSPWYRHFLSLDPAPSLRALKMPVLALLGGKDTQVTPQLNEAPLRTALADNPAASVEILPGLNHLFQTANTGAASEYGQITETINPVALKRMVDWIVEKTGAATQP